MWSPTRLLPVAPTLRTRIRSKLENLTLAFITRYTFFNGETFECTWRDGVCAEFSARQATILASHGLPTQRAVQSPASGACVPDQDVDRDRIAAAVSGMSRMMISGSTSGIGAEPKL